MATIKTFPHNAPLSEIIETVKKDGVVVIKNFLRMSTIEEMNKLIQPWNDKDNPDTSHTIPDSLDDAVAGFEFLQARTHRIYGLLGKMPEPVAEVMQNSIWTGIMDAFLSDKTTEWIGNMEITQKNSWQLTLAQSFTILPGCKEQPLHRDQLIHTFQPSEGKINTSVITCGIAGSNFTRRNGATLIVPGSHTWAKGRLAKPEEIVYAEAEAGSGIFWLGSTIHAGGANSCKTGDPNSIRQMFAIGASRDWCKPDENFWLSTPWSIWKTLPKTVLEKCGWVRTSGGAGYLDGEDAIRQFESLPRMEGL